MESQAQRHWIGKNINEKLSIRKYLKELDFETIKRLQRDHEARENMKEIETRLSVTRMDEQEMKIKERETIDDIVKIPENHYAIIAMIAQWFSGILTKVPNTEEQMISHTASQHFSSSAGPV